MLFHTSTFTEDRCARLPVKNLGRGRLQISDREKFESLNMRVRGYTHLRFGRRDAYPTKDSSPSRTSSLLWRDSMWCQKCDHSPTSAGCECRWSRVSFGHTQSNCGHAPRYVACGGSHISDRCSTPWDLPQCRGYGENHTANYGVCVERKEANARTQPKECSHRPNCRSFSSAGQYLYRVDGPA